MDQTVLLPVEGKGKYKLGNLSEEQINVLKEDPNNIFKALAIGGGTFLAYETFQHLVNIPKEDWENMLPDELEKFLSPFLHDNVDVEETIARNETELHTEDEMPDIDEAENAAIIHDSHEHHHNDIVDIDDNDTDYNDHHNDTLIIDDDDFDNNTDHHEMIEIDDISDIMEDEGIDHNVVEDFVSDTDFSIDSEMMDYIHSNDILIDLNDTSADEIIINDDYIADEDISIDDYSFGDDLHSEHHTDDFDDNYVNDDYDDDDSDNYMNHDNDDSGHHDDYMDDSDDSDNYMDHDGNSGNHNDYMDDSDDDDYETDHDDHHLNDDDSDLDDTDDTL